MWYQDGPSGSPGAAGDIIAMAQRRDSGARPDQALAVLVGHEVAVPGERDGPLRPVPRRRDDAVGVRVIADQFAGQLQRRAGPGPPARSSRRAGR